MESCDSGKFHPTLPLDAKYYQQCYQTFSRFMEFDMPYTYETWYRQVLGAAIRDKLRGRGTEHRLTGQDDTKRSAEDGLLRHMGVGSGSGELEIQILQALLEKFKFVYNRVIEPSAHQINLYERLVRGDNALSAAVRFDWQQQTLEAHLAHSDRRDKFDVVTSVHSIYYGGRMEEKVPVLYDLLTEDGFLVIVLLSDTDSLSQIQSEFLSPDIAGYRYYTKQTLQSFLIANNIQHDTLDIPRFAIDITTCFDDSSEEGAQLLDFLSHMKHFRTAVHSKQREKFMRLLRQNAHTIGNKVLLTHDTSVVLIQRTDKNFTKRDSP
ncbi:histamine N-methyltransferase-like [Acanthaster planci]|uniref:Histamine N-methyltransferase-like n=1 Tax=Acanthaster planci TaxID=133434 RepID=A0A8B7Z0F1_ACAPL|nr:histamine N-methyltransferase-like [Acanthaster planci]